MTPKQKQLVQASFAKVRLNAESSAALFYGRLFELDPDLEKLFQSDRREQGRKLMHMIGLVVSGLDHFDELQSLLGELGERHAGYGVTDSDYETVGAALLWTLAHALGDEFTAEVRDAWTQAYELLANAMKAGASEMLVVTANNDAPPCTVSDRSGWRAYFPAAVQKNLRAAGVTELPASTMQALPGKM